MLSVGFAAWAALVLAGELRLLHLHGLLLPIALAVPILLVPIALLHRSDIPGLALLAGSSCAVVVALVTPALIRGQWKVGVAVPVLVLAGVLTQRFPAIALALVFAITGTYASVTAFTGIKVVSIADAALGGFIAGIIGQILFGHRSRRVRLTPAAVLLAAFIFATLASALSVRFGLRALRLGPAYLIPLAVIGWGGFGDKQLTKAARIMVALCLVVAAYATLRWAIGASGKERAIQKTALEQQFNRLPNSDEIKTQGSQPTGYDLGVWMAVTIPFLVAAALAWRGRARLIALAAFPLSVIGMFASQERAAAPAAVAGVILVIVLHVLARGFRGPRLGVALGAALVLVIAAAVLFPAVMSNPQTRQRYENVLKPSQDLPYQLRVNKWRDTLRAIRGHPFGYGLGSGAGSEIPHRFYDIATQNIDNSYLLVGYEQGLAVMALFALALLVLLAELIRHAVWTRGPTSAVLAAAGAGTLVAMLVEFMAGTYIDHRAIIAGWMIVGLGVAQYGVRSSIQRVEAPYTSP